MTWIHFAIIEPAFLSGRALEPGGNQWSVCEERAGSEHRGYHREWDRNRSTGNTAWTELPTCWEIREQYTHWGGERLHTVSKVCVCVCVWCWAVKKRCWHKVYKSTTTLSSLHVFLPPLFSSLPPSLIPLHLLLSFFLLFSFLSPYPFIISPPVPPIPFSWLCPSYLSPYLFFFPLYIFCFLSTLSSHLHITPLFISVSPFMQPYFFHTPALYLSWVHVLLLSFFFSPPFYNLLHLFYLFPVSFLSLILSISLCPLSLHHLCLFPYCVFSLLSALSLFISGTFQPASSPSSFSLI